MVLLKKDGLLACSTLTSRLKHEWVTINQGCGSGEAGRYAVSVDLSMRILCQRADAESNFVGPFRVR